MIPDKQYQLEVILQANPMRNSVNVGIRTIEDILTFEEAIKSEPPSYPDYSEEDAERDLKRGTVTIFSSYPIVPGIFVTPSLIQAHAEFVFLGDERVYSKAVPLHYVAWINGDEGMYVGETPS